MNSPWLNGLAASLKKVQEANIKVHKAKQDLADANHDLIKDVMSAGWDDCLSVKIGQVRARLRTTQGA